MFNTAAAIFGIISAGIALAGMPAAQRAAAVQIEPPRASIDDAPAIHILAARAAFHQQGLHSGSAAKHTHEAAIFACIAAVCAVLALAE